MVSRRAAVVFQQMTWPEVMEFPSVQIGILIGVFIVLWKFLPVLVNLVEPKVKRHVNGTAGEQPKEFWELEISKLAGEAQKPVIEILNRQTEILQRIALSQNEMVTLLKDRRTR